MTHLDTDTQVTTGWWLHRTPSAQRGSTCRRRTARCRAGHKARRARGTPCSAGRDGLLEQLLRSAVAAAPVQRRTPPEGHTIMRSGNASSTDYDIADDPTLTSKEPTCPTPDSGGRCTSSSDWDAHNCYSPQEPRSRWKYLALAQWHSQMPTMTPAIVMRAGR